MNSRHLPVAAVLFVLAFCFWDYSAAASSTSVSSPVVVDLREVPPPLTLGQALDAPELPWETYSVNTGYRAALWQPMKGGDDYDDYALGGKIWYGQVSYLRTKVTGPGVFSFMAFGPNYRDDALTFLIDGSLRGCLKNT